MVFLKGFVLLSLLIMTSLDLKKYHAADQCYHGKFHVLVEFSIVNMIGSLHATILIKKKENYVVTCDLKVYTATH